MKNILLELRQLPLLEQFARRHDDSFQLEPFDRDSVWDEQSLARLFANPVSRHHRPLADNDVEHLKSWHTSLSALLEKEKSYLNKRRRRRTNSVKIKRSAFEKVPSDMHAQFSCN